VKVNWNQTGMPSTLVSRFGRRNELAEFKMVLNDAGSRVMRSVDAEALAQELVESGGREIVEMVRELTTALAHAERECESANRRYERLVSDLARRGIPLESDDGPRQEPTDGGDKGASQQEGKDPALSADEEWDAWDRKFQALLG